MDRRVCLQPFSVIRRKEIKEMTRGQRRRGERRAELIDNVLEWAAAAGIVVAGFLLAILAAML